MPEDKQRCGDCKYWERWDKYQLGLDDEGFCEYYTENPIGNIQQSHTMMLESDGESCKCYKEK